MARARTEPVHRAPPPTPGPARQPSSRWGDLRLRVLSAAVLAPLALVCIWFGGLPYAALLTIISVGLGYEWLGLCDRRSSPATVAMFASLPIGVIAAALGNSVLALALLGVGTIVATSVAGGMSRSRPLAFGIPYIGLGAVALIWLRQPPGSGGINVIVLLLVIWASDIGAYMAGRAIGGPRLAPAISPGKTWSGALGGLIAAALIGFVAARLLGGGGVFWRPVMLAVLIGLVSQAGDLFESLLKRHFGVKDSGTLIPGHGGLLDRLDAVLTAAPAAALLALVLGRGVVLWE